MSLKKLNVGCGKDIRKGWVNLDSVELPGVDIVHDIEKIPLPFNNNEFDIIHCQDIFEHVEYIPVFRELHRILKKGGSILIRVPHFTSRRNYDDPTHKKMFSIRTFEYFVKNSYVKRDYYFDFHFDRIISAKIFFEKRYYLYNYLVELIINANYKLRDIIYEATFLSRLFPADYMVVKLIK